MATPNKQTIAVVVVALGVLVLGYNLYHTFKSPSVPTLEDRAEAQTKNKEARGALAAFENANRGAAAKKPADSGAQRPR